MPSLKIVYQYNGYPESKAARVVRENITRNDEWSDYLVDVLNTYGIKANSVVLGTPYQPATDDEFVCVRVPVSVSFKGRSSDAMKALCRYCTAAEDNGEGMGFYCDSCWLEEV